MAENSGEDLYSLVSKTTENSSENKISKVQFGYTVDSYKGVLNALQQAQARMAAEAANGSGSETSGGNTKSPIFARWTEMGSINIGGVVNEADGFVVDETGNFEKYRQQQVIFLPFMPFVVEVEDDKQQKKPHLACFDSNNTSLNSGVSVARGAKIAFPPHVIDETVCDKIGVTVGGMSNSCEIGVAVDLSDGTGTPDAFFNKCYNKIYKVGMSGKLAARRALMVEIAFVNGSTANTMHARVIANSGVRPGGRAHAIYIPIPVLLTEEYDTLAQVYIENGEQKLVGKDVAYPFKGSMYNHLDASLTDFTPQYLKDIAKKQLQVPNCSCSFHSTTAQNHKNFGYIRFYIDKEKEAQIKDCLAGEIPNEYRSEIFKGTKEAKMGEKIIGYRDGSVSGALGLGAAAQGQKNDSAFYYEGQVDWEAFRKKYPRLPQGHEEIIERVAKQFNINTRMWMTQMGLETGWFSSKNFKTRKNPGGISAGSNYTGGQTYTLDYLGGVRATRAVEVRGEGYGHYWIFETFEDGYKAMAYLLVNSKRYGLGKKGAQTVYEHYTNMYNGGYCDLREAVCQNYNDKLMNQYAAIKSKTTS